MQSAIINRMHERKSTKGSLRLKTILFSGGVLLFLVLVFGALGSRQLIGTFRELQQSLLDQQIERFKGQLRNIAHVKALVIREYAEWDEAYDFLNGKNPAYLTNYFDPGKNTTGEDVVILFDRDRHPAAVRWLKDEMVRETPLSEQNLRHLTDGGLFQPEGQKIACLVEGSRVLLVAAGPVLRTDQTGPPAGWLVFGRWIDAEWLNETFDLIGMHVTDIEVMGSLAAVRPAPRSAGESLTGIPTWVAVTPEGDSQYEAKIVLPILEDSRVVVISVDIPMQVLGTAIQARNDLFWLGLIGGVCLITLPLLAFEWVVLRRLTGLDREIQDLTENSGAPGALRVQGDDEFARLAGSINRLMASERLATEMVKKTEGDARAIFESIGDPIFVHGYDKDGRPTRFHYVNEAACKFLDRSREELLKMAPGQVDEVKEERIAAVSLSLAREGHATFETLLIASDGSRIPVEIHANDVMLSGEKACISVARSLVVRKVIDARMREAKEAAEAANRAKSEFLATMSHEIRTPLHGVIGFAGILKNSDLPDHLRETVEGISTSADLLLGLVTDVLDFSRIEAGQLALNLSPVNLPRELKRISSATRLRAKEKGLAFACQCDPALPPVVLADLLRIEQVLGNLLSNALKFTERGEITLGVTSRATPAPDHHEIVFVVSDTGIGIGPDQRPRLFNPFSQADSSLSRRYGGSGLGLVIVKRLCELMGGTVTFESAVGKGSVFTATIVVQAADATVPLLPEDRLPPTLETTGNPLRVLIVEDNRLNQKLMRRLIEQQGGLAELAGNGNEALSMVAEKPFDMIFMDVSMPGMDGLEATRAIRTYEREKGGPPRRIVALTAGVSENERQACADAGMDDFLGKPFTDEGLKAVLRRGKRARDGASGPASPEENVG